LFINDDFPALISSISQSGIERTKANNGETTEGGINVRTTGSITTVKPDIIARKPAWV
jgi:hypothetical protein